MAGDRHGKHNTTTISFRVNSYEKATIEERVKVSGANYAQTECQFRYCGTAIPFLTVRSTAR